MNKMFIRLSLVTLVVAFAGPALAREVLTPADLRCEYVRDPMGVDLPHPRLFWVDKSRERGQNQSAYEILVASSAEKLADNQGDLWDSGKVVSDETIQIPYAGQSLKSSQLVFWKVRVWDNTDKASGWSEPATWTMGLLKANDTSSPSGSDAAGWQAQWIAAPTNSETLLLRHDFVVKPGLKRALVFVCGLGQYEMSLNGQKAGDDFLAPGWTDYRKTCLYDTRDITPLLHQGNNAVGLFLGNGMYNVERIPDRFTKFKGSFGPLRTIAKIQLEYADGTVRVLFRSEHWRVAPGPITFDSIYGGEDFDARLVQPGWNEPGFDDSPWQAARVVEGPGGELKGLSCAAPPIREFQIHRPVAVHKLADGDVVYDLGQNAAHILKISVTGPVGSRVQLFPAELTNADGSVNQGSMGAGHRGRVWCEYTKGTDGRETWAPRFFYVGCRYVQVHLMSPSPGSATLSPQNGEQRYLISWFKVGIFEDVIHQDDEFAHDGSEGDFGGLTRQAEALIKLFKLVVRMSGDECSHVEYPSDRSASATDAAASMPVTTFTRMRSQTGQCGSLAAVERAQFGQFGQYAQSGDGAHTSNGFELLHPFIQPRRLRAQFLELDFNLRQIPFQTADQALSLTPQGWQGEPLGLESLGDEDFEHLYPTADQFGQLLFLWGTWCGRLGKQCLTVGRQDGGVNGIGLGALAGGAGEVPDTGGVQDADRNLGFMQCRDNVAFVTAGGFTDDLDSGLGGQKFQQPPVAGGGVGQVVEATGQVKLQVKLGNIQAGVDSGHSVLAHSCKCERALVGRSINGSSLGHRHERLRLPAHLAKSQCQRTTNSSAPLPSGLQAGRRSHLPIRSVPDKDRWKGRYKRAGVRWRVYRWHAKNQTSTFNAQ